ncbi:MAG: hypothetical protein JO257_03530 [Deltaproteobacteria bacterium]|nr:hypothetical protein [Deltaproteobacteria bacterium]
MPVATPLPTKQQALAELVKLTREAGAPLPSNELPVALYNTLLYYFGGIQKARRAAKLSDPPQYREWSQADAVTEIRRLHESGVTIRYRDLELAGREDLVGAIRTYVGSIVRARILARVPHPPRAEYEAERWDEDRVVEDILDLHTAGESLAYSKAPSRLVNAGVRYFDSWDGALEAAGLDPDEFRLRRRPYDKAQAIARIRELAREEPSMNFGQLHSHPDGQALHRRFGSIEAGLKAAGLTKWPVRVLHGAITKEEVIAALKARHRAGKSLRKTALEEDSRLLLGITRRFKTIEAALVAAGLESEVPDITHWTREEVLRVLADRRDRGLALHASAVQDECGALYQAAIRFFGSYMGAARRFGAKPRRDDWTEERALAAIRRLAKKHGVLKSTHVPNGLLKACRRFWGTWEDVCRVAGVEHLDHLPRGYWTRDRLLEVLRTRVQEGQPVTANALGKAIASAVWRQFGGLDEALSAARVRR